MRQRSKFLLSLVAAIAVSSSAYAQKNAPTHNVATPAWRLASPRARVVIIPGRYGPPPGLPQACRRFWKRVVGRDGRSDKYQVTSNKRNPEPKRQIQRDGMHRRTSIGTGYLDFPALATWYLSLRCGDAPHYFASFTTGWTHAVSNSPATLPFTFGFDEITLART